MQAKAIIGGKLVSFRLSPELACAHRANAGRTMTDAEAVAFVEKKCRKARANWSKSFRRSRPAKKNLATTRQLTNEFDAKEWQW